MAYVNNGDERSLKISVYKKVGGNYIQGYPKVYNGQASWGNATYPTLTDTEVRQLSSLEFNARYNAFIAYVGALEPGINFNEDILGDGAIRTNMEHCLPSTTTTATPFWEFTVQYGTVPYSACTGSETKAYAGVQFPKVGDILYEDKALTIPWTKGSHVLFTNPAIYGTFTVLIDVVDFVDTSLGEILNTAIEDCNITTTTAIPVWEFAVQYGTTSYSACSGVEAKAYSGVQFPSVGDILYEDIALTKPWTKGSHVLFTDPAIYGTFTVLIDVVDFVDTAVGEILNTAIEDCRSTTTTTEQRLYYYDATEFTCPPYCEYVGSGRTICCAEKLTVSKYYAGSNKVFICNGNSGYDASAVLVMNNPTNTCYDNDCDNDDELMDLAPR